MTKSILYTVLVFGILLNTGCSKKQEIPESIRPVKYDRVTIGGAFRERVFTGTAKAGTEIRMSFKVGGTINKFNLSVGQTIKKNQLIAIIDDSDFVLEYDKANAAVKNADVQEQNSKSNFERMRKLYENGNTSLNEYEAAKAQYESAQANKSSALKARRLAKSQLDYTKLYAPVSGVVATVDIENNENVQVGQQIVMLQTEGDLEVSVGAPESFISQIKVQDEVEITFSSIPGATYKGIVSEVSFTINKETSTYPLTIQLLEESSAIRPGMAANVKFKFANESNANEIIVNTNAVGQDQKGNFVFVLEPMEGEFFKANKTYVEVGKLKTNGFEIKSGLVGNEMIATAGLQTLLDGMKVKLL